MCTTGVPGGKKVNGEDTFIKKRTMDFPEPMKDKNPEIQEAQNLSSWTNKNKATFGQNVRKTHTTKDQQKVSEQPRGKETPDLWRNNKQTDRRNDGSQNTVNSSFKMLEEINLKLDICVQEKDLRMRVK